MAEPWKAKSYSPLDMALGTLFPPYLRIKGNQINQENREQAWQSRYEKTKLIEEELDNRKKAEERKQIKQLADVMSFMQSKKIPNEPNPTEGPLRQNPETAQPYFGPDMATVPGISPQDALIRGLYEGLDPTILRESIKAGTPESAKPLKPVGSTVDILDAQGKPKKYQPVIDEAGNISLKEIGVPVPKAGSAEKNPTRHSELKRLHDEKQISDKQYLDALLNAGKTDVNVSVDARTMPLTDTNVSAVQKELIEETKKLDSFDRAMNLWQPEFSTVTFQVPTAIRQKIDRLVGSKDPNAYVSALKDVKDPQMAAYLRWEFETDLSYNLMRKFLTGVAGGEYEMKQYEKMLPSKKQGPITYINKMYEWQAISRMTANKLQGYLREGIPLTQSLKSSALDESISEFQMQQFTRNQFNAQGDLIKNKGDALLGQN
jgi:Fe-S cluster biosynthesis and repair protein YggX